MLGVEPQDDEKPIAQLLGELSKEISLLVHEEVQLAKVELAQKSKRLAVGAGFFGAAALAGLVGLGALAACAIAALALVVPLWLSALIVALVLIGSGGVCSLAGLAQARRGSPPVPTQAVESTKEDVAWLQKQLKSVRP